MVMAPLALTVEVNEEGEGQLASRRTLAMMSGAVAAMRTGSSCSRGKRRGAKKRRSAAGSGEGPLDLGAAALDAATSAGVVGFLPLAFPFPLPLGGSDEAAAAA